MASRKKKKASKKSLIVAVVLIVAMAAFISAELSGATGAFKLTIRQPDLEVTSLDLTQTEITIVISNLGTSARKGVRIDFTERAADSNDEWIDIGNEYLPTGLKEGKNVTLVHPWKQKTGGVREIKAVVDPLNLTREVNEDNNELTARINAVALNPDISVAYISVSGDLISTGISNTGSAVKNSFKIKFYTSVKGDVNFIGEKTLDSLKSGASEAVNLQFTPPSEKYSIQVIIDPDRSVAESEADRKNNRLIKEIS